MEHDPGLQISLLEGMDEDLLLRLHDQGIRSRDDLQEHLVDPERRRALSERLRVPVLRLEAIHHLNFVLPEERVARLLRLERRVSERVDEERRERRFLWRAVFGLSAAVLAVAVLVLVLGRTPSAKPLSAETGSGELRNAVERLEERVAALQPLARGQAETDFLEALRELGPAPSWPGPPRWTTTDHQRFSDAMGTDPAFASRVAVSVALARLTEIESPSDPAAGVLPRAREAAQFLEDFPPVGEPATVWDAAASLVRLRLQTRALGLSPIDASPAEGFLSTPWPWTATGFVRAELLLARVEALPLVPDVYTVWSETVAAVRREADAGRAALGDRAEAHAREYWIRRGELEIAVVAALLDKRNLLPYHNSAPDRFLAQRRGFLEKAVGRAPDSAKGPLRWLVLEYEEAARLIAWLNDSPDSPDVRASVQGRGLAAALDAVAERQRAAGAVDAEGLEPLIAAALHEFGDDGADVWSAHRLVYEAGRAPVAHRYEDPDKSARAARAIPWRSKRDAISPPTATSRPGPSSQSV